MNTDSSTEVRQAAELMALHARIEALEAEVRQRAGEAVMANDRVEALEAALEKLQKLIVNLERMNPDKITTQMQWFIAQAQAYLNGEYETIDQALGLEEDTSKQDDRVKKIEKSEALAAVLRRIRDDGE